MNLLRDRWRSDGAFRIAAFAAATGVAGVQLPGLAWAHGGGAFFVPFLLCAWLIAGPLIALEFGLGLCYQGTAPEVLRKLARRWEWLGWWAACVGALRAVTSAAAATWLLIYAWDAALALLGGQPLPWGASVDAAQAFAQQSLQEVAADAPTAAAAAKPVGAALLALALSWLALYGALSGGVGRLGRVLATALPIVLALILAGGCVAIGRPGAIDGVARLFAPQWSALADVATWTSAATLVLSALGVGAGVHVALASFLNRNADATGSAALTLAASLAASVAIACVVAAAVGAQAAAADAPLDTVPTAGLDALFATVAAAFASAAAPPWAEAGGACALFLGLAGLALAAVAVAAASTVAAIVDRWDVPWREASARVAVAFFFAGVPFATSHGRRLVEALIGAAFPGGAAPAIAALAAAFAWRIGLDGLQRHLTAYSVAPVGRTWRVIIGALAPMTLAALSADAALRLVDASPRPGAVGMVGVAACVLALLAALSLAAAAPRRVAA